MSCRDNKRGSTAGWRGLLLLTIAADCLIRAAASALGSMCPPYLGRSGSTDLPKCNWASQNYLQGSWIRRPPGCELITYAEVEQLAYPYQDMCNRMEYLCHVYEPNDCRSKHPEILNWAWQTSECQLEPFDAAFLDAKLKGKRVVFMGDSLQRQMFNAFKRLMHTRIVSDSWSDAQRNGTTFRRGQQLPFGLEVATTSSGMQIANAASGLVRVVGSGQVTTISIDQKTFVGPVRWADVLVLNIGHHWHQRDMQFAHYKAMARTVMRSIKKNFKGLKVFFRTSPPGNYDCQDATQPLPSAPKLNASFDFRYNWRKPQQHEAAWASAARAAGLQSKFEYLNVSFSVLRADAHPNYGFRDKGQEYWGPLNNTDRCYKGHDFWDRQTNNTCFWVKDCLHWCLPGVPDNWAWLLYNQLLDL